MQTETVREWILHLAAVVLGAAIGIVSAMHPIGAALLGAVVGAALGGRLLSLRGRLFASTAILMYAIAPGARTTLSAISTVTGLLAGLAMVRISGKGTQGS